MNPKLKLSAAALAALALALAPQAAQAQAVQDPPTPSEATSAVTSAQSALASFAPSLRTAQDDEYHLQASIPGANGLQFVTYTRTHKGLPVYGGEVTVSTDASGQVVNDITTGQQSVINVSTTPKVSAAAAAATSQARIKKVDSVSAPSLVVHAAGKTPRLAYATTVTGPANNRTVYVDALNGKVIDEVELVRDAEGRAHYVGTVQIDTQAGSMVDPNRRGLQCGGQNGSAFTGSAPWGNGGATDLTTACVDVLYGAQKEWDMLRDWVGRNGINGSGGGFPARVGLAQANAFWNGSYTNFGHNGASGAARKNLVSMDVVGHEYGHAIFQTTPGGAGSGNEAGGMNESTGDIFGALTEHFANNPNDPPDYLVGEEPALGGGPIRNMYNPSALGDPNCYTGTFPEVHAGAGPQNHWFYLLAEGNNPGGGKPSSPICSGGPSSVTGIGILKAGKIFMTTLNKKSAPWTHTKARVASLQAAKELFPGSCVEFNTVKAAWDAISLRAQPNEPTCEGQQNQFSLTLDPASGQVDPGGTTTSTVRTQVTQGSAQQITLRAGTLPSGVTAQFNPATITAGQTSTLTLTTTAGSPQGGHTIAVTADGAEFDQTANYRLTIGQVQNDFSFSINPTSGSTQPTGSTQTTISTQVTSGSAQQITLSATGAPNGVTVTFNPATITAGQTSQVTVSASGAAPGTYPIVLNGAGANASHSATYNLTVGTTQNEWAPFTAYTAGQIVTYQGSRYQCRQSHTSQPGWEPPNVLALWLPVS
ncbi:M4 family metallopeptidase [Nonomuraea typhae]|uniref:M4 family metallopeptidase n=1 Tax=Nonomuraea typhae TaxID=2603600 RepID=UPI0012FA6959|nr:M4 family metallopeptidase [Nonomuraea typhae]